MKIRMLHDRSGPRWDGQDWPPRGGEIDVPDDEGMALCGQGIAVPVAADVVEVPEQPDPAVEIRAAADVPAPPRVNAPRADWAAHAVDNHGADPAAVDEMTKAALIATYGKGVHA